MAQMIPPTFDEATTSPAERTLYDTFANGLDDEWTVIHSLPYLEHRGHYLREGECDFLLLHPRYGMLVVEAKSGSPTYDGRTRKWRWDDGHVLTDPYHQATRAMHFLNDLLHDRRSLWADADLAFGFAVAFPDAQHVVGNLPPGFAVDSLLLSPALGRIQAWVINLLGRFRAAAVAETPGALDSALDLLAPRFSLVPALGPVIDRAHREFVRLSADQAGLRANLADQRRMIVHGGAGTGKTVLLAGVARQEADAGKSVLVLCYNRALAADLAAQLTGVKVLTFHGLCEEIVAETGAATPPSDAPDYWDKLLPDAALTALPQYGPRFAEIMVDEGQDFRPSWWLLVEELLDQTTDNGWLIFCDDRQNLFDRSGELPFTEPSWRLRDNLRNTAPIAAFVQEAVGMPAEGGIRLPDGPEPVIHPVADAAAERAAVQKVLHELVHEQRIPPDDIVIIDPHVLARSSFGAQPRLGNLTVRHIDDPAAPNTIRHATAKKFKGLEADCVLLTGVGRKSSYYVGEKMRRFVYVGGSRARVLLHVFEWGPWRDD